MFPLAQYWWTYLAFTAFVLAMLALDLGVFHRRARAVSFREAAAWTALWITLALVFVSGLHYYTRGKFGVNIARELTLEFLTGYMVEASLSVDNIFVFVLIFRYFGIAASGQHRLLFYGILGALVLRAGFIAAGAALLQFHWVAPVFGVFLVVTGAKMLALPEKPLDPERNPVVRWLRRRASPALVVIASMEMADIVFAIDSVPAIFAITDEPFIVFTSNIFAVLGLRSMYFLVGGAVERFHLLRYGLALILVFVGLKMAWLNRLWGGHFPTGVSLAVIVGVLSVAIVLSLVTTGQRRRPL